MFGYIRKQKVLEEIQYLVDFEKRYLGGCISTIEECKDLFDSKIYDKHVRWALDNEQVIVDSDSIIEDEYLQGLIGRYNWNLSHYRASRTFADRLKSMLQL